MVLAVRGSESASTHPALQPSMSGSPSSASPRTPALLPAVFFDTAITSAENNAGVLSPISAASSSFLSDKPMRSTPAVGASGAFWPSFLGPGGTFIVPTPTSIWPETAVSPSNVAGSQKPGGDGSGTLPVGPTSIWLGQTVFANQAKGPANKDPDEPPKGSSAAERAIFYANRAVAYYQNANVILANALDLNKEVQEEAAVAGKNGKTSAQIAAALTEADNGVKAVIAAATAAGVNAHDAAVAAANAVAAQNDDDGPQANLDAEAAEVGMVEARGNNEAAVAGWGQVLSAEASLSREV